jgi:hypothetical protein
MSVDRRSINVLLSTLEVEQRDVAAAMGYRPGYVANVFNGFTQPSTAFKSAFGELLAELLLGPSRSTTDCYPAGPLRELLERRASDAPSRTQFYADLGLSPSGWNKRQVVTGKLVDRICCALGVHPTAIYPEFPRLERVS